MNLEKEILNQVGDSIAISIKEHLGGYNSPLKVMIGDTIKEHEDMVRGLVSEAINGVMLNKKFQQEMKAQIQHKIARELTNSFGEGIFKSSISKMKGDPTIRARCVLAVEKIIETSYEEPNETQ